VQQKQCHPPSDESQQEKKTVTEKPYDMGMFLDKFGDGALPHAAIFSLSMHTMMPPIA
jgi:hypothetical protein